MKAVFLFNPSSGGGAREREVARLCAVAAGDGHEAVRVRIGPGFTGTALREALTGAGALVIAGGDGTVHHALDEAVRADVPVYHVPLGTENLFAREFGMTRNPTVLRRLLGEPRARRVDLGEANGRLFALMCSVGPDAAVIHRLAEGRRGSITRWSYVPHMFREFSTPPPRIWAAVDGEVVVEGRRGMVLVGNSRQYAWRIDPAVNADMSDGLLDLVFMPAEGNIGMSFWLLRSLLGRHVGAKGSVYVLGKHIRIEGDEAGPLTYVQTDGEEFCTLGPGDDPAGAVEIIVRPGALKVLVP